MNQDNGRTTTTEWVKVLVAVLVPTITSLGVFAYGYGRLSAKLDAHLEAVDQRFGFDERRLSAHELYLDKANRNIARLCTKPSSGCKED